MTNGKNRVILQAKLTEEMIHIIHQRMADMEWDRMSLKDGKIGAFIFYSLYSEIYDSEADREKAQTIFLEIIEDFNHNYGRLDRIFLKGAMSFVWAVGFLKKKDMIEDSPALDSILRRYLDCRNYINTIPSVPFPDKCFYGEGVCYMSLFREEDTLERYALQEYLLSMIDNCGRMLTASVDPIYDPEDMELSFLHSVLYFLKETNRHNIYPTKADRLISLIREKYNNHKGQSIDSGILGYLLGYGFEYGRSSANSIMEPEKICKELSEVSLYSMIYSDHGILDAYIENIGEAALGSVRDYIATSVSASLSVMGVGCGLLFNRLPGAGGSR